MKIKLDENLPHTLVNVITPLGHDVDTVLMEGLTGHNDSDVWQAAQQAERFFVTQDLDFSDIDRFRPGTHRGILLVRLNDPGRLALIARLAHLFQTENVESWRDCFVVATEKKLRIRRP
jgi:predicted nuclease of predicted toxin-antitoxin system